MSPDQTGRAQVVAYFLKKHCHAVPGLRVRLTRLWDEFWHSQNRPDKWTKNDFISALDALKLPRGRGASNHVYVGNIDLKIDRPTCVVIDGKLVDQPID